MTRPFFVFLKNFFNFMEINIDSIVKNPIYCVAVGILIFLRRCPVIFYEFVNIPIAPVFC
jgi:hypothetical protein